MIQRIQTVYLFIVTILSILLLIGDIITFQNGSAINLYGIQNGTNGDLGQFLPLTVLLISIPVFSLILIFLYKNRRLQLRLTLLLMIFIIFAIAALIYLSLQHLEDSQAELVVGYKLFIPILILIFAILAWRGIKKDEDIVRSYDRLR